MPWIIQPAYLGSKMVRISQAEVDALVAAQTARRIFANWYKTQDVPPPASVPISSIEPTVLGAPRVGSPMMTDNGIWQHNPSTYAYKWYAAGVVIAGATTATYTPVAGDLGKTIQSEVIASNAAGPSAPVKSNPTPAVVAATSGDPEPIPVNVLPPLINGSPQVGKAITITQGTWSGEVESFVYQWEVDNNDLPGATGNSYTPVAADEGKMLEAFVIAINSGGMSEEAHAVPVGPIAPAAAARETVKPAKSPVETTKTKDSTAAKPAAKPAPSTSPATKPTTPTEQDSKSSEYSTKVVVAKTDDKAVAGKVTAPKEGEEDGKE